MRVAGANAAAVIAGRYPELSRGVLVYTGPGNNGGDGWVVARSLAAAGVCVHVCDVVPPSSPDAVAERAAALPLVTQGEPPAAAVVVDALLGTGASGAPRGALGDAVRRINERRARGESVVALDVPTGLDATTGAHTECVVADLTITFATCKRGLLVARDVCGGIVVVDIGLGGEVETPLAPLPRLVDAPYVAANVPAIPPDAHKGSRKKLVVIAGGRGMGGAAVLAASGALRSGVGMVKVVTDAQNVSAVQARLPEALTALFPNTAADAEAMAAWPDVVLMGPGLGHERETRELVERVLTAWEGPVLLDADALNVFPGDAGTLADLLRGRPAVITPHVMELARLIASDAQQVLDARFDVATDVARTLRAAVVLKGTPTVVTAPDGARHVVASGTAALATGGSGDILGGVIATLLGQGCAPDVAAACGAWVHGRAAALCARVRGVTLDDVLAQLALAWPARVWPATHDAGLTERHHQRASLSPSSFMSSYPILAELSALA